MISKEQYEFWKPLVEEYEALQAVDDDKEDCEDEYFDDDEAHTNCTCGAYVISNKGNVIHVADCICGAD